MKKIKEIVMRTVKHKLILDLEQESKLLEVMQAYQLEKNYFSDMLNSYAWNSEVNFMHGCSYREIRSSLVEQNYVPKNPLLPVRAWKLALEEAFQLQERTKLGQFYFYTKFKEENAKKLKLYYLSDAEKHVLNYIFFSWKNFTIFAKLVFDYKFKRKTLKPKKTLKSFKALKAFPKFYKNFHIYMETIFLPKAKIEKSKKEEYKFYKTSNKLINKLVYISKKIFQSKQILTEINPTMRLDSGCYNLYQDENGNNYLDILSLDKGKRIKGIKLTGYKGSLPKSFSSNLIISFNSTTMEFYIHFTFKDKSFKKKNKVILDCNENQTIGMDFGVTEFGTLSDGNVVGAKQGEILSQLNKKSEQLVAKIQKSSLFGYFGVELNNKEGKRNHKNNCFNHNLRNKNINIKYRKQQEKANRRLYNLKYTQVKELLDYCQSNNITQLVLENLNFNQLQIQGKNKYLKALNKNLNLIKGCFSLLEQKVKKNNINLILSYVNPAFTSQSCPACYFVDKNNRSGDRFRCQHCGYTPQLNDVRYKESKLDQPSLSEADFIAALNIKAFHFHETLKDNLYLKKEKIKEKLLEIHESKKENFCKDHFRSSVSCSFLI